MNTDAPYAAFRELIDLAGAARPDTDDLDIAGDDPVLPTPFRIGAAGAAALAAAGSAASHLWELRTGRRQRVAVDVRAAVLSLRSARYLRIDGVKPPDPRDPLSGFYPVRDGRFVYIHCNFRAYEWTSHPQAEAVRGQPLLQILRIGDAPPEELPAGERPLAGIRVLDLTRVLAGPTCARTLAEHGADVLKITAAHLPHSGAIELDTGLGKLASHLDLRTEAGIAALRALASDADVFSQSYRPGALAARGFSPEDLARLRPGIIYVTLSAWGPTGPWKDRRGFDTIVQTVSGMACASGNAEQPKLLPVSAIDYVSGYLMAFGAMVALARRTQIGGSWMVRVSLARTGQWIVDRDLIDRAQLAGVPNDLAEGEIERLCAETVAPAGRIRHLKPIVALSETPPRWTRPPVPLGYHPPIWPPRAAA